MRHAGAALRDSDTWGWWRRVTERGLLTGERICVGASTMGSSAALQGSMPLAASSARKRLLS